MINPFKEVNWNPNLTERRTFARSLIIGFPCVGLLLFVTGRISAATWDPKFPVILAGSGVLAGITFWVVPNIAKPFYLIWYCVACTIGLVVGNLLLGIVFYVFVTLIGLHMRLFGRDPLRRKLHPEATTYWLDVEKIEDPKRYYSQF